MNDRVVYPWIIDPIDIPHPYCKVPQTALGTNYLPVEEAQKQILEARTGVLRRIKMELVDKRERETDAFRHHRILKPRDKQAFYNYLNYFRGIQFAINIITKVLKEES